MGGAIQSDAFSFIIESWLFFTIGVSTFFVMFIGDLIGTLLIIYSIKFMLVLFDRFRKKE